MSDHSKVAGGVGLGPAGEESVDGVGALRTLRRVSEVAGARDTDVALELAVAADPAAGELAVEFFTRPDHDQAAARAVRGRRSGHAEDQVGRAVLVDVAGHHGGRQGFVAGRELVGLDRVGRAGGDTRRAAVQDGVGAAPIERARLADDELAEAVAVGVRDGERRPEERAARVEDSRGIGARRERLAFAERAEEEVGSAAQLAGPDVHRRADREVALAIAAQVADGERGTEGLTRGDDTARVGLREDDAGRERGRGGTPEDLDAAREGVGADGRIGRTDDEVGDVVAVEVGHRERRAEARVRGRRRDEGASAAEAARSTRDEADLALAGDADGEVEVSITIEVAEGERLAEAIAAALAAAEVRAQELSCVTDEEAGRRARH